MVLAVKESCFGVIWIRISIYAWIMVGFTGYFDTSKILDHHRLTKAMLLVNSVLRSNTTLLLPVGNDVHLSSQNIFDLNVGETILM